MRDETSLNMFEELQRNKDPTHKGKQHRQFPLGPADYCCPEANPKQMTAPDSANQPGDNPPTGE